ncbi:MAG: NifX-associated nitrogen fixation protein [Pseudanabaenaceae cyanobacterium SKYGB_i_bin29]|nr:NifX-associated nitrogen fixation protein [Pseudanabaenaceae cyanobacterium SKYG29]MDW8422235.1 NifX-associated nitrogen fixation protein [Pseudanabaenaceae cyanobacterium SKYGB_i_bin29]
MSTTVVTDSPFLQALVAQFRAQDPYGVYRSWSDERLLQPYILTKEEKRKISLEEPVDPVTKGRIHFFYGAVARVIEQQTGKLLQVVISLNEEGFGWALVFSGKLLVVCRTLRDAQRFSFTSLAQMVEEGEKLIRSGVALLEKFPAVAEA